MPIFKTYVVDDSARPLIYHGANGLLDDAEFAQAVRALEDMINRDKPYVLLSNSTYSASHTPTSQRKAVTDMLRRVEAVAARNCIGSASIVPSAPIRGVLTAVIWVAKPPYPLTVHGTIEEGRMWLQKVATKAGLHVPHLESQSALLEFLDRIDQFQAEYRRLGKAPQQQV